MIETDILIVGAGPAGLAAAIALRRKAAEGQKPRVVVLDKGRSPGSHVLSGAITGVAAFVNSIKVGSVTSSGGNQLETQILIALVLGGMPISGGAKVRFLNVIVGSLLYTILQSGLTMMGLTPQAMQLIQGVVFLVFVAVFADRESLQVIK